jgi:hypothetical protein
LLDDHDVLKSVEEQTNVGPVSEKDKRKRVFNEEDIHQILEN